MCAISVAKRGKGLFDSCKKKREQTTKGGPAPLIYQEKQLFVVGKLPGRFPNEKEGDRQAGPFLSEKRGEREREGGHGSSNHVFLLKKKEEGIVRHSLKKKMGSLLETTVARRCRRARGRASPRFWREESDKAPYAGGGGGERGGADRPSSSEKKKAPPPLGGGGKGEGGRPVIPYRKSRGSFSPLLWHGGGLMMVLYGGGKKRVIYCLLTP